MMPSAKTDGTQRSASGPPSDTTIAPTAPVSVTTQPTPQPTGTCSNRVHPYPTAATTAT